MSGIAVMPNSAPEILVIGGGVIGLVTAFTLRKAGLHVGLVEARRIGGGASGWAGGIVRSLHGTCEDVARASVGLPVLRDLRRAIGVDVPFHETGYVWFPSDSDPNRQTAPPAQAEENVDRRLSPGIQRLMAAGAVCWQDHAALDRRYPGFAARSPGAWLEPAAGWADPRLVCLAYAQAFCRLGGSLLEGVRVNGVVPSSSGVTLSTTLGEMRARQVVLALGDALPGFLDLHGFDHAFYVKPIEVGLFAPSASCRAPCFTDDVHDVYGKPDADGRSVHVGHSLDRNSSAAPGPAPVDPAHLRATRSAAASRFPWISQAAVHGGVRHGECFHESGKPVVASLDAGIGMDPFPARIFVAGGFSGTGIKMAPWAAGRILELIRERADTCDGGA